MNAKAQLKAILVGAKTYRTLTRSFEQGVPVVVTEEEWNHLSRQRTVTNKRMFRLHTDGDLDGDDAVRLAVHGTVDPTTPVPNVMKMQDLLRDGPDSDLNPDDPDGTFDPEDDGQGGVGDPDAGTGGDAGGEGEGGEGEGGEGSDGADGTASDASKAAPAQGQPGKPKTLRIRNAGARVEV